MKICFVLATIVLVIGVVTSTSLPSQINFSRLDVTPTNTEKKGRTPSGRIVGGSAVIPRDQAKFKHQVRIFMHMTNDDAVCGGSIISKDWVLTAAHCVESPKLEYVDMYFGMLDERKADEHVHRHSEAKLITVHPNWSRANLRNDIALIKLSEPLEFTDTIGSIRFGHPAESCEDSFGRKVIISGWGMQKNYYVDDSELNFVEVSVVKSKADCTTWSEQTVDYKTMYCLDAAGQKGACSGDSGGPMVYTQDNGLQLLLGLTSFGSAAGCESSANRVFTCINPFRKWISEVTGDSSFLN